MAAILRGMKARGDEVVRVMLEIIWNPEVVPDEAVVLYVHQHSVSPLTKTLGYFGPLGARFIPSDSNLPIKAAFKQALTYAKREGFEKLVIVDPVGFGWLELKGVSRA